MATYERLPPIRLNKAEVLCPDSFSSLDSPQQSSLANTARLLTRSQATGLLRQTVELRDHLDSDRDQSSWLLPPGLGRWTKRILINIPQPRKQMTSHPLCSLCAALALAYLCLVVCSLQRPPPPLWNHLRQAPTLTGFNENMPVLTDNGYSGHQICYWF